MLKPQTFQTLNKQKIFMKKILIVHQLPQLNIYLIYMLTWDCWTSTYLALNVDWRKIVHTM